jgi:uncharacterized surface protein with fasciclin (FAS1) repeats
MMNVDTTFRVIRRGRALLGAGLLAGLLVVAGCDSQDLGDANPQTPTVAEIATQVQALNTFGQALQRVGPANVLTGSGPYTVFAPLNGAFEPGISVEANPSVLRKVLQHHVVDGDSLLASDLSDGSTVQPLAGSPLTIGVGNDITVNRATVTNPDVSAQEGIVHVVDGLLADAVDRATLTPQFTIFARLVKETGLAPALRGPGANDGRTIFAPTNEALLAALDDNGSGEVESDEIPSNANEILQYHVLDSVFLAGDVPTSATGVPTLEGSNVTVQRSGETVTVNGNEVSVPNVEVDNGVIHGIDAVLMP